MLLIRISCERKPIDDSFPMKCISFKLAFHFQNPRWSYAQMMRGLTQKQIRGVILSCAPFLRGYFPIYKVTLLIWVDQYWNGQMGQSFGTKWPMLEKEENSPRCNNDWCGADVARKKKKLKGKEKCSLDLFCCLGSYSYFILYMKMK